MTYINSLHLIQKIGQIDLFSIPMKIFNYVDSSNTPNHRNGIPSPPTFTESVDGKFHEFPWLGDFYVFFESTIYNILKEMNIRKVKVDHLTLLICLPISLSLV